MLQEHAVYICGSKCLQNNALVSLSAYVEQLERCVVDNRYACVCVCVYVLMYATLFCQASLISCVFALAPTNPFLF